MGVEIINSIIYKREIRSKYFYNILTINPEHFHNIFTINPM